MAESINIFAAEEKLAALIWREAPLTSPELVVLAQKELDWKKSTTYTVLKKLCGKGVFKNENANVTVVLTRDELIARQSRRYVEDTFGGSLPKFITSFFGGKKLTPQQAAELKRLIDEHEAEQRPLCSGRDENG
ncbi:MAG: BlaI/MecI/CopY family transcriptional regulator [Clostridiales bacterium]|jgi:predicted transcriptional regulator|nr:BlaI/MecI/CopY family transcriptional regulator [Clostridiales bacterium]